MAKTNWQDPKTGEIISPHISGLQEAVGKLEESVGMESNFEENIPMSEVFISNDDRCRIYQAPEGKRNWLISPAPIVKKNGDIITDDFSIEYGGGAIVFTTPLSPTDTLTADVTYTKSELNIRLAFDEFKNNIEAVRYVDDVLELLVDGVWVEVKGGGGSAVELGNVMDLSIEPQLHGKMLIKWKDPEDIILDGITLSKWGGTQLRRKTTTYPIDNKDGELVVDSKVKDQFENGYLDEDLVDGQKYYYALFPYTNTNTFTIDVANRVSETAFEKYDREKPDKPLATGLGNSQVTISSSVGAVVSLDMTSWYPTPHTFTELVENQSYTPYARFEESEDYWESEISIGDSFIAVNKLPQSPPPNPELSNLKFDEVTVTGITGTEVRIGSGNWYPNPHAFTGLTAETQYVVYARMKETETHFASDSSNGLQFTTPSEVDDTTGSPGSKNLIAGTMQEGFFGEVTSAELISGDDLALECGISEGTSQNSTGGWLKFAWEGNVQFVAKKPFRHSISWNAINTAKCVHGNAGDKTVVIGGKTYKVRLFKGALTDPSRYDLPDRGAMGSEWNRLMLPIHIQAKDKSWAYPAYVESDIPYWGIDFTDEDLLTHNSFGNGSYSWCQEVSNDNPSGRVYRGHGGVSYSGRSASSSASAYNGWRPVLELVP